MVNHVPILRRIRSIRPLVRAGRSSMVALFVFILLGCSSDAPVGPIDTDPDAREVAVATGELEISTDKAPVAPDGTTAGAVTDFVVTFVDPNSAVDGIGMKLGGTIEVKLAEEFVDTGAGGNVVVILQGWPQSPRFPFPWTTSIVDDTITLTLTDDWMVGAFGPGPKQMHLGLFGFVNPGPGRYPVEVAVRPDPGSSATLSGTGTVRIIPKARPSVNVISLFSGPPGPPPPFFDPLHQVVDQGDDARPFGLYLWDSGSAPFVGVDVEMVHPGHGRLVEGGRTVGHVWIDAPPGAGDFELTTAGPSTLVPMAFFTGVPVGLLLVGFSPDPADTGEYRIRFRMNHGNSQEVFVNVVPA